MANWPAVKLTDAVIGVDFKAAATEPTAPKPNLDSSSVATLVDLTDSSDMSPWTVTHDTSRDADAPDADGKGYVVTSIQHLATEPLLVDQNSTDASSRLFVGNLTMNSEASLPPTSAHVAISLGDGGTIEAAGEKYGIGEWGDGATDALGDPDTFDFQPQDAFAFDGSDGGTVGKEMDRTSVPLCQPTSGGNKSDDGSIDDLAVDPSNPNAEVHAGDFLVERWQTSGVPGHTPEWSNLRVSDPGLPMTGNGNPDSFHFQPQFTTDDGLLLPAVQTDNAATWTAIAMAESGGDTDAHNPRGEDSLGLWQINVDPAQTDPDLFDCSELVQWASASVELLGQPTVATETLTIVHEGLL